MLETRSLCYNHRGALCVTSASNDLPFKTIVSIPIPSLKYFSRSKFISLPYLSKITLISPSRSLLFYRSFTLFFLSMSSSWFPYLCLIETQTECGPISLCSAECWGGLQIKKPSPGCAHQAVQHSSPGRFTTYILFYGPFLIHHNTASILLTSPAKHTSLPVPSVFFSLFLSIQHISPPMMLISTRTQV